MHRSAESESTTSLTRDLLEWLARMPRTYAETMEMWRSSCPRLAIWEDALADGFVTLENDDRSGMNQTRVVVTSLGRQLIEDKR